LFYLKVSWLASDYSQLSQRVPRLFRFGGASAVPSVFNQLAILVAYIFGIVETQFARAPRRRARQVKLKQLCE